MKFRLPDSNYVPQMEPNNFVSNDQLSADIELDV